ncbi:uncharacterized protein N7484_003904 [Penicillium longicatenatum]|uniref:uncharacterized protein n=1 Tax=Penicillium longicatenatum TaxID=1561947 RepID=UPI0025491E50|nr:uncharacterized protein N7484_003904 [Penicillium longicatenatum]KAJ5650181.1 hypothetical protein N7484_003904 [Penicillium longicatenatum]
MLLKQKWAAINIQLVQFKADMTQWRIQRRCWELNLIIEEWQVGSMECLPLEFTLEDIVQAKISVLTQNEDDANGLIAPFTTGQFSITTIASGFECVSTGYRFSGSSIRLSLRHGYDQPLCDVTAGETANVPVKFMAAPKTLPYVHFITGSFV